MLKLDARRVAAFSLAFLWLFTALVSVLTLWRPSRRLWLAQMIVIAGYTAIISLWLPQWWLHPFGPISKNIPILALLWLCAQEK